MASLKSIMIGSAIASLASVAGIALANDDDQGTYGSQDTYQHSSSMGSEQASQDTSADPQKDVKQAAEVLETLRQQEPELAAKVPDAKGVFIIPDYATAALLIGGSGGEGVLMTQNNGEWGNPGFYDVGSVDIGAQAGAAAGPIVLLLMSDNAVQNFQGNNKFSLDAEAGLTVVNWSAEGNASTAGTGDVIAWSNTKGLMAKASVGVGGISWDEDENQQYYNQQVSAADVLNGNVENPNENVLQTEFAQFSSQGSMQEDDTSTQQDQSPMHEDQDTTPDQSTEPMSNSDGY